MLPLFAHSRHIALPPVLVYGFGAIFGKITVIEPPKISRSISDRVDCPPIRLSCFGIISVSVRQLFYTEIGNGCEMIDGFYLKRLEELEFDETKIREDFIFTRYWIWEDDKNKALLDKVGNGNISLIDIGDCQSWNIIVTGEERGRMWFFTDVGIQPCVPNRGFLSWFEYWLDGNENYFGEF